LLALAGFAILPKTALAGQFKAPVYYPAPGLPVAVVAADFNHDGNLDLAVADFGNEVVETLLRRGDGSFRKGESISIMYPYSPTGLAVGDFDGDHILDLVVVEDNGPANGEFAIFLGNGDGTFRNGAEYQLGFEPLSAAVADFNGDGRLDIVATNRGVNGNGSVMVFFGRGDGTFSGPTTYKLPFYPYSVAAGDLLQRQRDTSQPGDLGCAVLTWTSGRRRVRVGSFHDLLLGADVPQRSEVRHQLDSRFRNRRLHTGHEQGECAAGGVQRVGGWGNAANSQSAVGHGDDLHLCAGDEPRIRLHGRLSLEHACHHECKLHVGQRKLAEVRSFKPRLRPLRHSGGNSLPDVMWQSVTTFRE
jgi:hypothetical protein